MRRLGDNFEETLQLYREGEVPTAVFRHVAMVVLNTGDEHVKLPNAMETAEKYRLRVGADDAVDVKLDYEYAMGGYPHLVNSSDDLKQIDTFEQDAEGERWLTLDETSAAFDDCSWLEGASHVVVYMTTNNSGGNWWYVPARFVTQNVLDSIKKSNETKPLQE